MSEQFTFVTVNLTNKHLRSARRGEGIDAKDRTKIRSFAATCPWNKKLRLKGEAARRTRKSKKQTQTSSVKALVDILEYEDSGYSSASPSLASTASDMALSGDFDESSFADLTQLWAADGDFDVEYTVESPWARWHSPQETRSLSLSKGCGLQQDPFLVAFDQSLPRKLRTDQIDPFWSFSIPYRPCLSAAIEHRVTYFAQPIPAIDAQGEIALLKHFTTWMDNTAYMFSSCLLTARHLYEYHQQYTWMLGGSGMVTHNDIIWLEGCAYNAVNKLLRKPCLDDYESEAALGAVLSLAIYENCFGNRERYRSHLSGAKRIIALKGGMSGLHPLQLKLLRYMTEQVFLNDMEDLDAQPHVSPPVASVDAENRSLQLPKTKSCGSLIEQIPVDLSPLDFIRKYSGSVSYDVCSECV